MELNFPLIYYDFSQFLYVDSGVIFIDCPQWFAIEGYSILVFSLTTGNRDKSLSFPVFIWLQNYIYSYLWTATE